MCDLSESNKDNVIKVLTTYSGLMGLEKGDTFSLEIINTNSKKMVVFKRIS